MSKIEIIFGSDDLFVAPIETKFWIKSYDLKSFLEVKKGEQFKFKLDFSEFKFSGKICQGVWDGNDTIYGWPANED